MDKGVNIMLTPSRDGAVASLFISSHTCNECGKKKLSLIIVNNKETGDNHF